MNLNNLQTPGGKRIPRKRIGRGEGSGQGKTSGRGHKGQKSRSGATTRPWFEGGQMPLQRRLPKRGFHNVNHSQYQVVNVSALAGLEESEITNDVLEKHGLIRKARDKTKVLGDGDLGKAVTLKVHAISKTAREKVEKAGGKVEILAS